MNNQFEIAREFATAIYCQNHFVRFCSWRDMEESDIDISSLH